MSASNSTCARQRAVRVVWLALLLFAAPLSVRASDPEILEWPGGDLPLASHLAEDAWTLVMFWSVTCEICAAETPRLNAFHQRQRTQPRGVRLLGVSIDGSAARTGAARWMARHEMEFPSLLAELADAAAYFHAAAKEQFLGTPTFMIFDRRGELVGVNAGPVRVEAIEAFVARKERGG